MSALTLKLTAALESRDRKRILLKIPPPSSPANNGNTLNFTLNEYLSLSKSPEFRQLFLDRLQTAPSLFGSGGSRVAVNWDTHAALETRLARFFNAPTALLAGSGYDANVAFFRHVPQRGDIILHDEYIHASIYDGMRSANVRRVSFIHNDFEAFLRALQKLAEEDHGVMNGTTSVFLAVESVYSMDGSISPLNLMVKALEEVLPKGNGHLVVDEAHATGIYGLQGRGIVSMFGIENKCLARLHTFGKALSCVGGASPSRTHITVQLLTLPPQLSF